LRKQRNCHLASIVSIEGIIAGPQYFYDVALFQFTRKQDADNFHVAAADFAYQVGEKGFSSSARVSKRASNSAAWTSKACRINWLPSAVNSTMTSRP
jgi:hypothetical protein